MKQLDDPERHFFLTRDDIIKINPNTRTAPIFRSKHDAEHTTKIYSRVPPLISNLPGSMGNTWGINVRQGLFHLSNDIKNGIVIDATRPDVQVDGLVPVYEGKQLWSYDHRFSSYNDNIDTTFTVTSSEKMPRIDNLRFRYFVSADSLINAVMRQKWNHKWFIGWRDITNATNERTIVAAAFPFFGVSYTIRVITSVGSNVNKIAALLGALKSPFENGCV